jgi:hypothetical protein
VAGAAKLLCCSQASGTAANHGNQFAGGLLGRLGMDPALVPRALDNGALDELDRYGRLIDAENAGCLAGSGADATGELVPSGRCTPGRSSRE